MKKTVATLVLTGLLCISGCNAKNDAPATNSIPANSNESNASTSTEEINIEMVANDSKRYEGTHIRWNGYTMGATKAADKVLLVSVKPGYLAYLTLREPLKKVIAEKTDIWFEGDVDGNYPMEIALYSPAGSPEGKAKMIGLENATFETKK